MQKVQTQKGKHQWKPQQPSLRTGGANFSGMTVAKNTMPGSPSPAGWAGAPNQPMGMQTYAGQVRRLPFPLSNFWRFIFFYFCRSI